MLVWQHQGDTCGGFPASSSTLLQPARRGHDGNRSCYGGKVWARVQFSAGRAQSSAVEPLSRADRAALGKDARTVAPLESHGEFSPGRGRDPVGLLLGQAASRVPELVPGPARADAGVPFTFYRGAALADGCGPGRHARLGAAGPAVRGRAPVEFRRRFASPERRLVFDVNDFDETLPGPFEWDVKRLAASLAVAGRAKRVPR